MAEIELRPMEESDWLEVADLICIGTNYWYATHGMQPIFRDGPTSTLLFCEIYETLDPGCCILAVNKTTGRIMGSCFYHPRETHVSLGIMNVHPNYFGQGVAGRLLRFITSFADARNMPVRLVSSAMNLDSFSLYTRAGFVPRQTFQDMYIHVPENGMPQELPELRFVREASHRDIGKMADLEAELCGIRREKDFRFFVDNDRCIWHTSVYENERGALDGFLVSVSHPGSNMLGPGVMRNAEIAATLILAELNANRGCSKVFLVPVSEGNLVQTLYAWGARNCELHVLQVRGSYVPVSGVLMPTFMPETG